MPHSFQSHMDILLIIKVKTLVLIKWSYRSSELCCLWSLEWLTYFEHVVQSVSKVGA